MASICDVEVRSPRDLPRTCDCGGRLKVWTKIYCDVLYYFAECEKCGARYCANGWWGIYRWRRLKAVV